MRNRSKLLLTGLTAALVLAAAVSTASARSLSVNEREFRAIWTELSFSGGGQTIICPVSLLGSFHRTSIAKSAGSLIGAITSADLGRCLDTDNRATILRETLPWHITYRTFTGELPEIAGVGINLINASFNVGNPTPECLARTDTVEPAGGIVNVDTVTGQVDNLRALPEFLIDLDDPDFFCDLAGNSSFNGTASATTPTGNLLFVDLI